VLVLKVLGVIVGFCQLWLFAWLYVKFAERATDKYEARHTKQKSAPPARHDEPYDGAETPGFVDDDTWWSHV